MQRAISVRSFESGRALLRSFRIRPLSTSSTCYQRVFKDPVLPKTNSGHTKNIHNVSTQTSQTVEDIKQTEADSGGQPSLRFKMKPEVLQDEPPRDDVGAMPLNGELASWSWLGEYGPGYATEGSNVKLLETPEEYYQVLIEKSKNSKQRITLASLYLGTGILEQQLVETVKKKMEEIPDLKVTMLLDFARGSRGKISSRTMLQPLLLFPTCQVFLYHTPTLRGAKKKILPQRWNELVGLQHMKVYVFDDSVLITGANLSNDYFTNRQDRYILIENCRDLADFFDGLISKVSSFSLSLDSTDKVHLHSGWTLDPVFGDSKKFLSSARERVVSYYEDRKRSSNERLINVNGKDTWIFPIIQMGPFGISYDSAATIRLFNKVSSGSNVKLATGYFNLTPNYIGAIISNSTAKFQILMAHPQANGFYGAKFPAGGIPAAYTLLAKRFLREVDANSQYHRISMSEYLRPGWTFHGKGLWLYPPGENLPFVTLIGSPNFGYRSVYRDLETQLYIATTNQDLRKALDSEQNRLYSQSHDVGDTVWTRIDRQVPLWVHLVIRFFKNFF